MTRKRPHIPVATWNDDDSTHRIGDADELRAQHEKHNAKVGRPPRPPAKLSTRDMLRYLAMFKLDSDCAVPAAVVDEIATALAGDGEWLKAQKGLQKGNEKKRSAADRRREEVRHAAANLPGGSIRVKTLAEQFNCSARTIRRYITED
jgi:hypothetical protein